MITRGTLTVVYLALLVSLLQTVLAAQAIAGTERQWQFSVYLDDKAIGYHDFTISQTGEFQQLTTQARLDVEFLNISLFKYRHDNTERWSNRCLKSISSTTDDNGTLFRVNGSITGTGFQLSSNTGNSTLPSCIKTFAYWDKSFLEHSQLLNSQTGEYVQVSVAELSDKTLTIDNTSVAVNRYRLTAEKIDIEVWYSESDQWVGLQSTTDSGRLIRYVIE